jgi:hypothetical protein
MITGTIILLICIFLFFLSSLVKNWLVKNSESLIGRRLDIGELHFNYATVSVQVDNLVFYEKNGTDRFFSFRKLFVDFSPWKLVGREFSLSEIRLEQPYIQIIQNGDQFNFDSLIREQDSVVAEGSGADGELLKFSFYNIKLEGGELVYTDEQINSRLDFSDLNIELPLVAWNNRHSDVGAAFTIGEHGQVELNAVTDSQESSFRVDVKTTDVPVRPVTGYLKEYVDVELADGFLTSEIHISGDMNNLFNLFIAGQGKITGFMLKDGRSQEILSAKEVRAHIAGIDLQKFHFGFSGIEIDNPRLLVVRDKDMTNIERLFLPYFRNDSITEAAAVSASGETETTYAIDTLRVNKGEVSITDNTLNRPFNYAVDDLDLTMYGLTESAEQIPVTFLARLNNRGTLEGKTVLSITEPMNIEFEGRLRQLDLVSFSPYSEYYIASPVTQGWLNYDLLLKMTPKSLVNENKIRVEELEFGKRTKDTTALVKAPVRLALYIMKDINDLIRIDMPVSGNPSDPQFKLGKLIWKTFGNLMVKTAASPFNALAGLAGANPESIEQLDFDLAQDSLSPEQKSKLALLATILKKKSELVVEMTQHTDINAEKLKLTVKIAEEDFLVGRQPGMIISSPEATFEAFVRQQVPEFDSLGMERACQKFIAVSRVDSRFITLLEKRDQQIHDFLITGQGLPEQSVRVSTADLRNLPEQLRVPHYKIEVLLK